MADDRGLPILEGCLNHRYELPLHLAGFDIETQDTEHIRPGHFSIRFPAWFPSLLSDRIYQRMRDCSAGADDVPRDPVGPVHDAVGVKRW